MKVLKLFTSIIISFSLTQVSFARETRSKDEIQRDLMKKYSNSLATCSLYQTVKIKSIVKNKLIPVLKKTQKRRDKDLKYFKASKGVMAASFVFGPRTMVFLPLTLVADILLTPYYIGDHIIESVNRHSHEKVAAPEIRRNLTEFKAQWKKITPNRYKRIALTQQLKFYGLVRTVHNGILSYSKAARNDSASLYQFKSYFDLIPQFEKKIGKIFMVENKYTKSEVPHFQYKNSNGSKKYIKLFKYWKLWDFRDILLKNPKLCTKNPIVALKTIYKEYVNIAVKRIKEGSRSKKLKFTQIN